MQARKSVASLASALVLATAFSASSADASQRSKVQLPCANWRMTLRPASDFPNNTAGRVEFRQQYTKMEKAVLCMVNRLRRTEGVPEVKIYKLIGRPSSNTPRGIQGAAYDHARAGVELRWWGKRTLVQNDGVGATDCRPKPNDPDTCDSHYNPVEKTEPEERAAALGYRCESRENTYTGYGQGYVSPAAAFAFWAGSAAHRANMVDSRWKQMTVSVQYGSANPAAGETTPAATYVQIFGSC